jgi:hypothetical protein
MKLKDYLSWSMTPALAEKWQRTREMGMIRYVFLFGVLRSGIFMAIFMLLFKYISRPEKFDFIHDSLSNLWLFAICGLFTGVLTWGMAEKQYLLFKKK